MKETPVVIGDDVRLIGVLGEPVGVAEATRRPACIFINAGVIHRVGPNRLYVKLARSLTAQGYATLRLDLSARGDNAARRDGLSFLDSSIAETLNAMDFLRKRLNVDRFVLMGICSGAINSLRAAITDERVVGAVAMDAPAYPTLGYYFRLYARRALTLESWRDTFTGKNLIGKRLRGDFKPAPAHVDELLIELYGDARMSPKSEAIASLQRLSSRETKLLMIYTGSWRMYNYRNQFRDAFPEAVASGNVEVHYMKDADHTFTELQNQERLLAIMSDWLGRRFGEKAAQSSTKAS